MHSNTTSQDHIIDCHSCVILPIYGHSILCVCVNHPGGRLIVNGNYVGGSNENDRRCIKNKVYKFSFLYKLQLRHTFQNVIKVEKSMFTSDSKR